MNLRIERIYDELRRRTQKERDDRAEYIYQRLPELRSIPEKRRALVKDAAMKRITAAEASEELDLLDRQERKLLEDSGFSADMLEVHPRCPFCRDTGWIGEAERKPCACRLKLLAEMDPGMGINSRQTFERFSEDIYPTEEQKRQTRTARIWCEQYADSLPSPEKKNLLLTGMAGLGKTYLCNSIAYRALSRGIDARVITAYTFIQTVLEGIRTKTGAVPDFCLRIPLLIIDDLGSESVIPNISEEALFSVLNERIHTGKPTVVATNLSYAALQERYGERVTSRLADRTVTQAIQLTGENLRRKQGLC
ncbi:MAG: ATP-binding protein [Clostridia bacterium]|nr:ATP-binding protein [Clostridia bacterium]MBR0444233.1 ATP-binding protein [Clostridia bacterium]